MPKRSPLAPRHAVRVLVTILILLPASIPARAAWAVDDWLYHSGGNPGADHRAIAIIRGADGNLYIGESVVSRATTAGTPGAGAARTGFLLTSLRPDGSLRWRYEDSEDEIRSVACSVDPGGVYVAGGAGPGGADSRLFVIALSASGVERWRFTNGMTGDGVAVPAADAVAAAYDGSIYVVGGTSGTDGRDGEDGAFIVSLDAGGALRWSWRLDGSGRPESGRWRIIAAPDRNIYASGTNAGDHVIVSLTPEGSLRWIRRFDTPWHGYDTARGFCAGADGALYACGDSNDPAGGATLIHVFAVAPDGTLRWSYLRSSGDDRGCHAADLAMGPHGSIYVAGASGDASAAGQGLVVSLSSQTGQELWTRRWNGGGAATSFETIAIGIDNRIYAGSGGPDFAVARMTWDGAIESVYAGGATPGGCVRLVDGADGHLYASGYQHAGGGDGDVAVTAALREGMITSVAGAPAPEFRAWFARDALHVTVDGVRAGGQSLRLALVSVDGRRVLDDAFVTVGAPADHLVKAAALSRLPPGLYYLELDAAGWRRTRAVYRPPR